MNKFFMSYNNQEDKKAIMEHDLAKRNNALRKIQSPQPGRTHQFWAFLRKRAIV